VKTLTDNNNFKSFFGLSSKQEYMTMRIYKYLILILICGWFFVFCSPKETDINKIELDRILNYFQKQIYFIQVKGKKQKTDKKIFQLACENFNKDEDSARELLKKLYPDIEKKIYSQK
jgi:hypothetical protein